VRSFAATPSATGVTPHVFFWRRKRFGRLAVGEGAGNAEADGLGSGIFKVLPEALPSEIANKKGLAIV
jgi:hypothetical protein